MTSKELQKVISEDIDVYKVLHSTIDDEPAQIKTQYMQLMLAYHPDKLPPETKSVERKESEEKFHSIQKAYNILQDQALKDVYDKWYREHSTRLVSSLAAQSVNQQIKLQEYGVYLRKLQHFNIPLDDAVSFEKFSSGDTHSENSKSKASSVNNQPLHENRETGFSDSKLVESKQLYVRVESKLLESSGNEPNCNDIELIKNTFTKIKKVEPLDGNISDNSHEYIVEFLTFPDTLHNLKTVSRNTLSSRLVIKPMCFMNGTYHFKLDDS